VCDALARRHYWEWSKLDTGEGIGFRLATPTGLPMRCLDVGADSWGTSKLPFVSVRNWSRAAVQRPGTDRLLTLHSGQPALQVSFRLRAVRQRSPRECSLPTPRSHPATCPKATERVCRRFGASRGAGPLVRRGLQGAAPQPLDFSAHRPSRRTNICRSMRRRWSSRDLPSGGKRGEPLGTVAGHAGP
jgi:hypothetical protein